MGTRVGWQKVRCINEDGHPRGDRNPSASVNLTVGYYTCHACGLKGDTYTLAKETDGWSAQRVNQLLDVDSLPVMKEEETWLV